MDAANEAAYKATEAIALGELKALSIEADVVTAAFQAVEVAPEFMPAAQYAYQREMNLLAFRSQMLENQLLIAGLMRAGWTTSSGESMGMLAARLRAGGKMVIKAARTNVRIVAIPAIAAVKAEAVSTLPRRGGLNNYVASARYTASVLTGPKTAGVTIRGTKSGHDLKAINAGVARHPTRSGPNFRYTNRKRWSTTQVRAGYFDRPLTAMHPVVRAAFLAAMNEAARVGGFKIR